MMKRSISLIALALAVVSLFSCSKEADNTPETSKMPEGKSGSFTIVYTGNIGGKVRPCGCRIPLGGLARRSAVINGIREETDNAIVLDSGAMLYPHFYLYPPYDYMSKLVAHLMAETVNNIGVDALNVSSYDVVNSADSLLAFDSKYPGHWLSANVVRKNTTEPVFTPDMELDAGDFHVGVFGFMAKKSQGINIFTGDHPLDVLDPVETVRKETEKLKNSCDIIIALAYMDLDDVKELIRQVPGINVVIASHTREHNPSSDHRFFQPVMVDDTIIVRCPDGGRVVGRLDLSIARGSLKFVDHDGYVDLRPEALQKKDPTPIQSTYTHEFIDLGPSIDSDPVILDKVSAFAKMIDAYTKSRGIEYRMQ